MKKPRCVELCIIYTAFSHSAGSIRQFTEKFLVAGAVDLKSVDDMSSSIQWGPGASGCKVGDGYNDCWFAVDEVSEP